jgi:hypothetical protein
VLRDCSVEWARRGRQRASRWQKVSAASCEQGSPSTGSERRPGAGEATSALPSTPAGVLASVGAGSPPSECAVQQTRTDPGVAEHASCSRLGPAESSIRRPARRARLRVAAGLECCVSGDLAIDGSLRRRLVLLYAGTAVLDSRNMRVAATSRSPPGPPIAVPAPGCGCASQRRPWLRTSAAMSDPSALAVARTLSTKFPESRHWQLSGYDATGVVMLKSPGHPRWHHRATCLPLLIANRAGGSVARACRVETSSDQAEACVRPTSDVSMSV